MSENNVLSSVQLEHCVFEKISFERKGFRREHIKEDNINLKVAIKQSDDRYTVSLIVTVDREEEFEAQAQISGVCIVKGDVPNIDVILRENIPAILFPYVRAQLTMLTSQPETNPIVLPVINIHNMANSAEKKE